MPINAQGYFNHLKSHLNMGYYAVEPKEDGKLVLSETTAGERTRITLKFEGQAFAIKLDKSNQPLFHFLDNHNKPWTKRCDFVIFNCHRNSIKAYCIEFKLARTRIPAMDVILQLKSGVAWCRSLSRTVNSYTNVSRRFYVTKYVFTACQDPAPDLDPTGKYLTRDNSIRHYLFDEVHGINLHDLENDHIETIN